MLVYRQFGIELPRCSYEQAEVGIKIPVEEALPGDLVFYARDGAIYHVLMAIGDGKAINASSSTTGIIISDINMDKACWAVRILDDGTVVTADSSTQAAQLVTAGRQAYQGDLASKQTIIDALAKASEREWQQYGFCRSVIIAQAIQESGWGAFSSSSSGIQAADNNILGMNEELRNGEWVSPWTGGSASRLVPQYSGGGFVYNYETMRTYEDIESCMDDYAAFKIGLHPELRGVTDVDTVISIGLKGYATDPTYQDKIRELIDEYNLTEYDVVTGLSEGETTVPDSGAELPADVVSAESEAEAPADAVQDTGTELPADEQTADAEAPDEAEDDRTAAADVRPSEDVFYIEPDDGAPAGEEADPADAEEADELYPDEDSTGAADSGAAETYPETGEETPDTAQAGEAPEVPQDEETPDLPQEDGADAEQEAAAYVTDDEGGYDDAEYASDDQAEYPGDDDDEGVEETVNVLTWSDEPEDFADGEIQEETDEAIPAEADPDTVDVYEPEAVTRNGRADYTEYTEEELETIWARVAQEDDTSYDGALAVITTVMNRADLNYGGYGVNAYDQLAAPGQFAGGYEDRLGGNVPDFVKQAVADCLESGLRNHTCTEFRYENITGNALNIGANWYFN